MRLSRAEEGHRLRRLPDGRQPHWTVVVVSIEGAELNRGIG